MSIVTSGGPAKGASQGFVVLVQPSLIKVAPSVVEIHLRPFPHFRPRSEHLSPERHHVKPPCDSMFHRDIGVRRHIHFWQRDELASHVSSLVSLNIVRQTVTASQNE
jgi:hypothetical protein